MTISVKHNLVSTQPDDLAQPELVQPSNWNDDHTLVGFGTAAGAATTDFDASGTAAAGDAAHVAALDPHPQYLTAAEGVAAFDALGAATAVAAAAVLDGDTAGGDLAGTYPNPTVTQARGLRETAGPTTLAMGAVADGEFLKRSGATVIGGSPGAASLSLTTVEVDLGTIPRRGGKFNISTSGLTSDKAVAIAQGNGPYTGKGTRTDEAEMDGLVVTGKTTSTTNIECFWHTRGFVKGKFKFNYVVGA